MLRSLYEREITGKKIRIDHLVPLRKTNKKCILCEKPISGVILDIFEDMDVWGFRYHYFLPWNTCHSCRPPLSRIYI